MNDYVVESGASTRARSRRRRAAITLSAVLLLLFGAFWYAYSYYRDGTPATASPTPCVTTTTKPVAVKVNVYNATNRDGLAASTAALLKKRGFVIGTVSNDPLHRNVKATAEVRYGAAGVKLAPRVESLVAKPAKLQDKRKDASVDLVIGNAFTKLAPAPTATTPVCTK